MAKNRADELLERPVVDATGEVDIEDPVVEADFHEAVALRQQLVETREALKAEGEKLTEMRRQIEADADLVRRFMAEGRPLNAMVTAAAEKNRNDARVKFYESIKGVPITIQIHTHEDPRRNFPVFVALNGVSHDIPRGVPYTLPGEFLAVLDEARFVTAVKEVDEATGEAVMRVYDHLSYPYVVISQGVTDDLERIAQAAS